MIDFDTIKKIILILNDNLGIILALLVTIGGIIERSKAIGLSPISSFLSWVGREANKELISQITETNCIAKETKQKVMELEEKVDENERDRIRHEILGFAYNLRDGKLYSKDAFQHLQELYYKYCEVLKSNGLITEEYSYIRGVYLNMYSSPLENIYNDGKKSKTKGKKGKSKC